jgi:hypothetical protein
VVLSSFSLLVSIAVAGMRRCDVVASGMAT